MIRFLIVVFCLSFIGCTSYQAAHTNTVQTEAFLANVNPGDPVILTLSDGTIVTGSFFGYKDGLVTLQIGDFFRDTELSKIQSIEYKSEGKHVKAILIVLITLTGVYIIYEFVRNH